MQEELDRRGVGHLVLPTLTKLAVVSGDNEPTRRRVRRNTLTPQEQEIIDAFVDASLLKTDYDTTNKDSDRIVEVAHEALLRQWAPLRQVIETDRAGLRLRSELEHLAADWQENNRDDLPLARRPLSPV